MVEKDISCATAQAKIGRTGRQSLTAIKGYEVVYKSTGSKRKEKQITE